MGDEIETWHRRSACRSPLYIKSACLYSGLPDSASVPKTRYCCTHSIMLAEPAVSDIKCSSSCLAFIAFQGAQRVGHTKPIADQSPTPEHSLRHACVHAGALKVEALMKGLGEVSGADAGMAYLLWVLVFPIVWATLSENKEQQVQLAKPIIALLSRQSNPKQAAARPNVVQVRCRRVKTCRNMSGKCCGKPVAVVCMSLQRNPISSGNLPHGSICSQSFLTSCRSSQSVLHTVQID